LKKSLFNFMHGICFDYELQDWFDFKIPKTKIHPDFIANALEEIPLTPEGGTKMMGVFNIKPTAKIVWLGRKPIAEHFIKSKKGNSWEMMTLTFHDKKESFSIQTGKKEGEWLVQMLGKLSVSQSKTYSFKEIKSDFETNLEDFELFWYSKPVNTLREFGLLVL